MPLKRDKIKFIRDRAKSGYQKGPECYICKATEKLDFHHYYSLTPLLNKWLKESPSKKEEDILEWRDEFIQEHQAELYDHTVTLCRMHHLKLHSIYGKDPALATVNKQKNWVEIQRDKHGMV